MRELKNQTIYRCDYCAKRFLSKNGAKIHEQKYCYASPLPKMKRLKEIQSCEHDWVDTYSYITGEAVMQPESEECSKCGVGPGDEERLILNIKKATARNSD